MVVHPSDVRRSHSGLVENAAVRCDQGDAAGKVQSGSPEEYLALGVGPHALEISGDVLELERKPLGRSLVYDMTKRSVENPDEKGRSGDRQQGEEERQSGLKLHAAVRRRERARSAARPAPIKSLVGAGVAIAVTQSHDRLDPLFTELVPERPDVHVHRARLHV